MIYVVIDVGCHECGVESLPIGAFTDFDAAHAAAKARNEESKNWRDGGQTIAQVFAVSAPLASNPTEGSNG